MNTFEEAFRAQAAQTPNAWAVRGRGDHTYADLLDRVARLADVLAGHVEPGELIALDFDDPLGAGVAMLAAARIGCAFLPLNTSGPEAYREQIVADARAAVVIRTDGEDGLVVVPTGLSRLAGAHAEPLTSTAYVIYTSGSTGRPKGVAVPHHSLTARLSGLARTPGLRRGESIAALTALSFDISLAEILLPLTVGAHFVVPPEGIRIDPGLCGAFLAEWRPDVVQATPSFWRLMNAAGWQGAADARLWCGGEALTAPLARELIPRAAQLWNLYGPTEATVWVSASLVSTAENLVLGVPLPGSDMCLDTWATPSATEGEILLYGDGLADGYLGQADLTAERFLWTETPNGPRRVYRTGDRARRRPDGALEFLGRTDGQIKLRGHRIELGEVEAALEACPDVSEAVVLLQNQERPERSYLSAYVVTPLTKAAVRRWMSGRLPASHQPAKIEVLEAIPRTAAGKADRVRLAGGGVNVEEQTR